jgi:hypothetical protein
LRERRVFVDHGRRGRVRGAGERERPNQHRACPLEKIHPKEGLGDRPADGQRPVIAKQHDVTAAQVALKPRPLIEVERYALIVVIDEVRKNELRRPEVRPRRRVDAETLSRLAIAPSTPIAAFVKRLRADAAEVRV